jgi:hypothetical protein
MRAAGEQPPVLPAPAPNGFASARNAICGPGRRGMPIMTRPQAQDQAFNAPEALAMWVAIASISPGDRQS